MPNAVRVAAPFHVVIWARARLGSPPCGGGALCLVDRGTPAGQGCTATRPWPTVRGRPRRGQAASGPVNGKEALRLIIKMTHAEARASLIGMTTVATLTSMSDAITHAERARAASGPRGGQTLTRDRAAVPPWRRRLLTPAGLLLFAPAVAFVVLRIRPMYTFDSVDPFIYTGYAHNTPDMMARFGPHVYYWVRLGTIIPERLAYLAFGALPGFYVLRYLLVLLIVVPFYVLLSRLHSRTAGLLGVTLFLTSPVLYSSLGSDYPDAMIFGYLGGAFSLLFMPWRSRIVELLGVVAAGVLMTAAVHSQLVCAPFVAALVIAYVASTPKRRPWRATAVGVGVLAATAVLTTAGFSLVAKLWLGYGDIFTPTLTEFVGLQKPEQQTLWHSSSWVWAAGVPYIAVPVVVLVGWLAVVVLGRPPRMTGGEIGAGIWLGVSVAATYYVQFRGTVAYLEFRLYSSTLWVPVLVLLTFLLLRLVGAGPEVGPVDSGAVLPSAAYAGGEEVHRTRGRILIVAGAVVVAALAASVLTLPPGWTQFRVTVAALAVLLALCVIAGLRRSGRARVILAVIVAVGLSGLTVAPPIKPHGTGLSDVPIGRYDEVLGHLGERDEFAAYQAAAGLPEIVGPASSPGQSPQFWASSTVPVTVANQTSATYLWRRLHGGMPAPAEAGAFAKAALASNPEPLVIVATSPGEAKAMLDLLTSHGVPTKVGRRVDLTTDTGPVTLWVATLGHR